MTNANVYLLVVQTAGVGVGDDVMPAAIITSSHFV